MDINPKIEDNYNRKLLCGIRQEIHLFDNG